MTNYKQFDRVRYNAHTVENTPCDPPHGTLGTVTNDAYGDNGALVKWDDWNNGIPLCAASEELSLVFPAAHKTFDRVVISNDYVYSMDKDKEGELRGRSATVVEDQEEGDSSVLIQVDGWTGGHEQGPEGAPAGSRWWISARYLSPAA